MSTEIEQSRIDFEAYVSSITGSQNPLISRHWTVQGYSEASGLEPFWQCWTAAQLLATAHQPQGNGHPAIRLELVRYLTDGLHIRKWENLGDLPPGIHTLYSEQVQNHGNSVAALTAQSQSDPVLLTAVAVIRERHDEKRLEWLLEGGICELEPGQYLIVSDQEVTDDEGYGELYRHRPAQIMEEDQEELIGQLADDIGRSGMCSADDRELLERVIDAGYRKQVSP